MKKLFCTMMLSILSFNSMAAQTTHSMHWSYHGKQGPEHWGELDPSFRLCSKGKSQSPINIPQIHTSKHDQLSIHYQPATMIIADNIDTHLNIDNIETITNTGHGIQINFPVKTTQEYIKLDDERYELVQFHIHTPSENKIQGYSYPLEIHFVHQNNKGKALVIAVFAMIGKKNPTLQKIIDHFPKQEGLAKTIPNTKINPYSLLPNNHSHYQFMGSLTTPPCSEHLLWLVLNHPITASPQQINAFKHAAGGGKRKTYSTSESTQSGLLL